MNTTKIASTSFISCLLLMTNLAFASTHPPIEFFASNNTKEIDTQTAYERLTGKEQKNLENDIIAVLQKNHIEQGKFEDILGTYRMSSDQNITADNTDRFTSSPEQELSQNQVFSIAKELAVSLNQDSVAVLIPNTSTIGDITVTFTSHQPTITEVINILHDKLPMLYNQAFSLHLADERSGYNDAKVVEIEWLGSKINVEDIKKAFPTEKIDSKNGDVYLVYQNGQKEQL